VLQGATRQKADSMRVSQVMVALTHERKMAGAFCVAVIG
jgi:phosphopantetheinyl transferase (holo-ACP synthase)